MDRQTAIQALALCDQVEQAIEDGDHETIERMRDKVMRYFTKADEAEIKVAVECIRARAEQVLSES
jgi:hypothetical protein